MRLFSTQGTHVLDDVTRIHVKVSSKYITHSNDVLCVFHFPCQRFIKHQHLHGLSCVVLMISVN